MKARIGRIRLAQHFPGWTLEYIDTLDQFTLADIWGVLDADSRIKSEQVKAGRKSGRGT